MELDGSPLTRAYNPYKIEDHVDTFHVILFDQKSFMYSFNGKFPYLEIEYVDGVDVCVSFFYRPKNTPGARVSRVIFDKSIWDENTAIEWVSNNGLHLWEGYLPRNT